jgi:mono/diheme cytochrome c family protein
MKKYFSLFFGGLFLVILMSFHSRTQRDPWPVPDKYVKMANPVESNAASIAEGKELYTKHCKSCHGSKGKGDGPKAAQLDTECGDFTTADFHKQTDGSLYYKTAEGRKDMPSFKKKIPEANDIWSLVNYMRTLK